MRQLGKRKIATRVAGHQNCGTCHPEQEGGRTRERRNWAAEEEEATAAMERRRAHADAQDLEDRAFSREDT